MTSNTGIVKLNIGGTLFHTTKSTLTKFDGFFKTVLETDVPVTKDDSGAFFIDRSPKHFDTVLNFMRDGNVELSTCEKEIKEISKEAQYYLLTGLVELCAKESEAKRIMESLKVMNSDLEVFDAVLRSKKPVVVISLKDSLDFCHNENIDYLKEFIERHSFKWNIFIKKSEKREYEDHLALYANGKETFICSMTQFGTTRCGLLSTTILDHIEHHVNQFL
ncbi:unnamed protein product [Caenorhabditis brenneri]